MQGTVVMLLALSGLGCHHKNVGTRPITTACYSSCYSSLDVLQQLELLFVVLVLQLELLQLPAIRAATAAATPGAAYSPADVRAATPATRSCYSARSVTTTASSATSGSPARLACAPVEPVVAAACDTVRRVRQRVGGGVPVYGTNTPVYDGGYASGQYDVDRLR